MEIKELIEKIEATYPTTADTKERLLKKLLVTLLNELSEKEFTATKQEVLNNKIDSLFGAIDFNNMNPDEIKTINKKRIELKKFLAKELNVIPEGYFRGAGFRTGMFFGGICLFVFKEYHHFYLIFVFAIIGAILGSLIDRKIKKQGETLKF